MRAATIASTFVANGHLHTDQGARIEGLIITLRAWLTPENVDRIAMRVLAAYETLQRPPRQLTRDRIFAAAAIDRMCPFATPPEDADHNLRRVWLKVFYAETARTLVDNGWLSQPAGSKDLLTFRRVPQP